MVETVAEALDWFREIEWKNNNSFHDQMGSLPNDGKRVTQPIIAGDGEFLPRMHNPANERALLHNHESFVLMYMYVGACETAINETPLTLRQGDILILTPNVLHRNALVDKEKDIMFHCRISLDLLCNTMLPLLAEDALFSLFILGFLHSPKKDGYLYFPGLGDTPSIRRVFDLILIEYANKRPLYRSCIRSLLGNFLTMLARARYPEELESSGALTMRTIMEYIGRHAGNVTLGQMAQDLHYHQNYLSARIRKETGESFSQIAQAYRLMRASLLLQETALSTEEIARMVGYRDVSGFYRAFKRRFGQAPRESVRADATCAKRISAQ